ncbi:hypothetical protein [Cupriavidus sp. 8B]
MKSDLDPCAPASSASRDIGVYGELIKPSQATLVGANKLARQPNALGKLHCQDIPGPAHC